MPNNIKCLNGNSQYSWSIANLIDETRETLAKFDRVHVTHVFQEFTNPRKQLESPLVIPLAPKFHLRKKRPAILYAPGCRARITLAPEGSAQLTCQINNGFAETNQIQPAGICAATKTRCSDINSTEIAGRAHCVAIFRTGAMLTLEAWNRRGGGGGLWSYVPGGE